ncbi:polysaccharide lyase family 7 protein [Pseudomonas triticicola]|uniref:Polysaccharide lyase family 7 protein n=1 Tax=Pseudomonas triticicola TaxID=2842345 RepID=A0ABS6RJ90_9PSED|nr:polysaccharide lyase family 7 protein [Pseudomonas triticicola]MBV4546059.1 polysaccharide lyase family 7 protein [Pseudomonas triticicola]
MAVNISNLTLSTPVAVSATNPVALELNGAEAIAQFPSIVTVLPDGSLQLSAPTKGASSKSTHRTRCEWKESFYWPLASAADHLNYQEMTVTKVNSAQKVVISQMHVKNDDSPAIKVFWQKGNITMGFRQSFNQPTPVNTTVLKGVPLGAKFKITIRANSAGVARVTVDYNGVVGTSGDLQLDSTWNSQVFNFHGGVYNQIDYTDATPPEDGSICIISDLLISHT